MITKNTIALIQNILASMRGNIQILRDSGEANSNSPEFQAIMKQADEMENILNEAKLEIKS